MYQQIAKTNTFSSSLSIYFFSPFFPKTHRNQDLGMSKNGFGPPVYALFCMLKHCRNT